VQSQKPTVKTKKEANLVRTILTDNAP